MWKLSESRARTAGGHQPLESELIQNEPAALLKHEPWKCGYQFKEILFFDKNTHTLQKKFESYI